MNWLEVSLTGLVTGVVGTGAGSVVAFFVRRPTARFLGGIMAFSAGVMLSIIFLELIEEANYFSGYPATVAGLLIGLSVFYVLDRYLPHQHAFNTEEQRRGVYLKKGVLLALGIGLHNLPEGLAIGAGFIGSTELGLTLTILIALHNIPEGMAVAVPLKYGGYKSGRILAITAIAGAPMGVGALLGVLIGGISPALLGISLGFAAGAMLYIVCDELIPDAYISAGAHLSIAGIFAGVILGILFIAWF